MSEDRRRSLVLRLAGPLQAWGASSQFNHRATGDRPSKSGVIGLLAAAQGRSRGDSLEDLLRLELGVRVDQPGRVLHDFHTVSRPDGGALPSASVNAKGVQKKSKDKATYVTTRDYLADAVFVVAVRGPETLMGTLEQAVRHPRYPLALGRRSCPPAQPLVVEPDGDEILWEGPLEDVLKSVPWQAGVAGRREKQGEASVALSATVDDAASPELVSDLPTSFAPRERAFAGRSVRHLWLHIPTGFAVSEDGATPSRHDPFALLGW